jgi:hypothetical protein
VRNDCIGETGQQTDAQDLTENVIEVDNILCSYQSLQVLVIRNVLLAVSNKMKENSAVWHSWHHEDDKPLYLLTEMCEVQKLNKTGTKET